MLPTTGILDCLPAPHPGSAVEVEKHIAASAPRVLQHKMPVEQNGFHFGQEGIITIDVRPTSLHHPDLGIGEVMDSAQQKIRRRYKVRVKDYNQLALRCLQSLVQCACLVSRTIGAMNITDWMPLRRIVLDQTTGHVHGFVS